MSSRVNVDKQIPVGLESIELSEGEIHWYLFRCRSLMNYSVSFPTSDAA